MPTAHSHTRLTQDPQYRSSLALRLYSLDDLARHLRTALPPGYDHPMPPPPAPSPATATATAAPLGRPWDGGYSYSYGGGLGGGDASDSPSGMWLRQLWALINGLLAAAAEWQSGSSGSSSGSGSEGRLEPLANWPLLPVLGPGGPQPGLLLPVRHARLAICLPPPRSLPVAGKEGAQAHAAPGDAAASSDGGGADTGAAAASAAAGPIPSLQDLVRAGFVSWPLGRKPRMRRIACWCTPRLNTSTCKTPCLPTSALVPPSQAPSLPAPWDWLAPALHCLGVPLVDPRFNAVAARHCGPQPAELGLPPRALDEAAAVAAAPPASLLARVAGAAAAAAGGGGGVGGGGGGGGGSAAAGAAVSALVSKLRQVDATMGGGALAAAMAATWDGRTRAALLGLLAEATPR